MQGSPQDFLSHQHLYLAPECNKFKPRASRNGSLTSQGNTPQPVLKKRLSDWSKKRLSDWSVTSQNDELRESTLERDGVPSPFGEPQRERSEDWFCLSNNHTTCFTESHRRHHSDVDWRVACFGLGAGGGVAMRERKRVEGNGEERVRKKLAADCAALGRNKRHRMHEVRIRVPNHTMLYFERDKFKFIFKKSSLMKGMRRRILASPLFTSGTSLLITHRWHVYHN